MIRKLSKILFTLSVGFSTFAIYAAPCVPTDSERSPELDTKGCYPSPFITETPYDLTKTVYWSIYWLYYDPYSGLPGELDAYGSGQCFKRYADYMDIECWPAFNTPIRAQSSWKQDVYDYVKSGNSCSASALRPYSQSPPTNACKCDPQNCPDGEHWRPQTCTCVPNEGSPIIIDLNNDGYRLTDGANGVWFDLAATGVRKKWSWTARGSDDAFLVLDRNNDGSITNGKELFGNFTDQPVSEEPNGFIALAVFDHNGDRWINDQDEIFSRLRLWVDANHNGMSERNELRHLDDEGIIGIGLDYRISRRSDECGNKFRYYTQVRGRDVGRVAWDVFLQPGS